MNWSSVKPKTISDMALFPSLKKILIDWEKKKSIEHCYMVGSYGTGKTTAAEILAQTIDKNFRVHECNVKGDKKDFVNLISNYRVSNLSRFMGETNQQILVLDEFHNTSIKAQDVLKKFMDNEELNVKVIICANHEGEHSPAIKDRCWFLPFDAIIGKTDSRSNKTTLLPASDSDIGSVENWKKELERCIDIMGKKLDIKITAKIKDNVYKNNPTSMLSVRRYVSAIKQELQLNS